jgi:uncharacterized protein (DUF433 family)
MDGLSMLDRELYDVTIASEVLRVPPSTLRWWLEGGVRRGRTYMPVLRPEPTGSAVLTWGELVEAGYLAGYRKAHRVRLWRLRDFIGQLREALGVPYPLATARPWVGPGPRLLLEASQVTHLDPELRPALEEASTGQLVMAGIAERFLARVEFEPPGRVEGEAARIRPIGNASPVVIDPTIHFGVATVSGISTSVLAEKVAAGEPVEAMADAYGLRVLDVVAAIDYEKIDWPLLLTAA